jgi:Protein of unknown function (DUF1360)
VIPAPYQFILLALIAYRAWRLVAEDEILTRPRRYLVRLPRKWKDGDILPESYRETFADFFNCAWCMGAWVSLIVYAFWMGTLGEWPDSLDDVLVGFGVWFAISCSVGLIRAKLDPSEE